MPTEHEKALNRERSRRWREKNRETHNARNAAWRESRPDYFKEYHENHPELKESHAQWKKSNPDKVRIYKSRRRAKHKCLLVGDEWNDFVIGEAYSCMRQRSSETGIQWHVDHVVPLCGKKVSGFHVWYNLRVIPAKINLQKGNH